MIRGIGSRGCRTQKRPRAAALPIDFKAALRSAYASHSHRLLPAAEAATPGMHRRVIPQGDLLGTVTQPREC